MPISCPLDIRPLTYSACALCDVDQANKMLDAPRRAGWELPEVT